MRSPSVLVFCSLLSLGACGGNADFQPPSTQAVAPNAAGAGSGEAGASAAGASSAGASGAETSTAGANSAGASSTDTTCDAAPVVVGCGCTQDPTPPPEVWNCIACETLPSTSASVGPEGGSFTLRGPGVAWFKLTIPPHALAVPTTFRISRSVRPPVSLAPASDGYSIEPTGIGFAVPASVTVPLAANRVGSGLYWSPDVCSEPVWVDDSAPGSDTVSGTITRSGVVFATSVVVRR